MTSVKINGVPEPLSSQGIAAWTDFSGGRSYREAHTESHAPASLFDRHCAEMRGVVWVRLGSRGHLSDVNAFAASLDRLQHPIVLLTTDGDCTVPSDLDTGTVETILDHPLVLRWYTQNHDGSRSNKIRGFPIGLDLHSLHDTELNRREKLLLALDTTRRAALPVSERSHQLACDLHLNSNSTARYRMLDELKHCPHVEFIAGRVSQAAIWRFYSSFSLALSTHGHGLDCHRTWEQLKLGCIVVTRTSSLDPLYEGLPVAIVEDWSECHDRAQLEQWIEELAPLTDKAYIDRKLSCAGWIERLRAELTAFSPS